MTETPSDADTDAAARPVPSWLGPAAIDAAAVLMFVGAGRSSHDESASLASLLGTAAPFLVALAVGWLATPGARRDPTGWRTALGVWAVTVVLGLVLRRTAWDRGTAASFVLVTALTLGALFFGWRGLWAAISERRTVRSSQSRPG